MVSKEIFLLRASLGCCRGRSSSPPIHTLYAGRRSLWDRRDSLFDGGCGGFFCCFLMGCGRGCGGGCRGGAAGASVCGSGGCGRGAGGTVGSRIGTAAIVGCADGSTSSISTASSESSSVRSITSAILIKKLEYFSTAFLLIGGPFDLHWEHHAIYNFIKLQVDVFFK